MALGEVSAAAITPVISNMDFFVSASEYVKNTTDHLMNELKPTYANLARVV